MTRITHTYNRHVGLLPEGRFLQEIRTSCQKQEEHPLLNNFVKALSTALEEASDRPVKNTRARKNKAVKGKTKSKSDKCQRSSTLACAIKSDSESSLDSWIHHQMNISKIQNQCTDSDDHKTSFASWRQASNIIGESDSVTESAQQSREPRRKRRLKRMATDPPAVEITTTTPKNKRCRNQKLLRNSKVALKYNKYNKLPVTQTSTKARVTRSNVPTVTTRGKRKRCSEESGYASKGFLSNKSTFGSSHSFSKSDVSDDSIDHTPSEGSSSYSEGADREADDEQSDVFCESGPSRSVHSDDDEDYFGEKDEIDGYCELMEIRLDVLPALKDIYEIRRKEMYETFKKKIEENGRNVKAYQRRLLKAYRKSFTTDEYLNKLPRSDKM